MGKIRIGDDRDLIKGDHIYIILTEPIVYEHHGIYIGDGKVIHFANMIVECSLVKFAHGLVVRRAKPDYSYAGNLSMFRSEVKQRYTPDQIVQRAKAKLGTGLYNLSSYNDEHFASWCVCGAYTSSMVQKYQLDRFQKLVHGFDTMDMYQEEWNEDDCLDNNSRYMKFKNPPWRECPNGINYILFN